MGQKMPINIRIHQLLFVMVLSFSCQSVKDEFYALLVWDDSVGFKMETSCQTLREDVLYYGPLCFTLNIIPCVPAV